MDDLKDFPVEIRSLYFFMDILSSLGPVKLLAIKMDSMHLAFKTGFSKDQSRIPIHPSLDVRTQTAH